MTFRTFHGLPSQVSSSTHKHIDSIYKLLLQDTNFQCARYLTLNDESEKADVRRQLVFYIYCEIQRISSLGILNPNTANSREPRGLNLVYPKRTWQLEKPRFERLRRQWNLVVWEITKVPHALKAQAYTKFSRQTGRLRLFGRSNRRNILLETILQKEGVRVQLASNCVLQALASFAV